jgi:hypothetical protein
LERVLRSFEVGHQKQLPTAIHRKFEGTTVHSPSLSGRLAANASFADVFGEELVKSASKRERRSVRGIFVPQITLKAADETLDRFLSGKGKFDSELLAPSMLLGETSSAGSSRRIGVGGSLNMGRASSAKLPGSVGLQVAPPVLRGSLSRRAGWMAETRNTSSVAELLAVIGSSTPDARGPTALQSQGAGLPFGSRPRRGVNALPESILLRGTKAPSPAIARGEYQGGVLSKKRELYVPPPPTVSPAKASAVAPRAAMAGGGSVDTGESPDRGAAAHQTGVPSLESIEDTAREVLSEIKRRWGYELERRGIE